MTFRFDDFELDEAAFELRRAGQPIALEPQVFELLRYLVEHGDRLVPKTELLDEVWGDRFVSESALTSRVKAARQALGDDGRRQAMIRTIHGRGYRFVGELRTDDDDRELDPAAAITHPHGADASPTDWASIAAHYAVADRDKLATEDFAAWATAAWWTCQLDLAIELRQEAFRRYLAEDDRVAAAMAALRLAEDYFNRGVVAADEGWLSRAEHVLDGLTDTTAHRWLIRCRARRALERDGDAQLAIELADSLLSIPDIDQTPDLLALSMQDKARALIEIGRFSEGGTLLDESMTMAIGGNLDPMVVGRMYCNMMSVCMDLGDVGRAGEWTVEAERWCATYPDSAYPGVCRVHRAGLHRHYGDLEAASVAAAQCTGTVDVVHVASHAWDELGEIALRRDDLDTAENAFDQARQLGSSALPGQAYLYLARGDLEAGRDLLLAALRRTSNPGRRSQLLVALTEAYAVCGDVDAAAETAALLSALHASGLPGNNARVAFAGAVAAVARGDWNAAVDHGTEAAALYSQLRLDYEAALARVCTASAYDALGEHVVASLERGTATRTFEDMGAVPIGAARSWLPTSPDA
jgi:DNA-binding winged helix-turn-helix (wHTH) protein